MLNKIKLKNFKKFQQGEFQFHTGTNILIGANDAGKSTILKAIDIVLSQTGTDDGADVKIMDRFFWHLEVPDSEKFSKPGFQLKTA